MDGCLCESDSPARVVIEVEILTPFFPEGTDRSRRLIVPLRFRIIRRHGPPANDLGDYSLKKMILHGDEDDKVSFVAPT